MLKVLDELINVFFHYAHFLTFFKLTKMQHFTCSQKGIIFQLSSKTIASKLDFFMIKFLIKKILSFFYKVIKIQGLFSMNFYLICQITFIGFLNRSTHVSWPIQCACNFKIGFNIVVIISNKKNSLLENEVQRKINGLRYPNKWLERH